MPQGYINWFIREMDSIKAEEELTLLYDLQITAGSAMAEKRDAFKEHFQALQAAVSKANQPKRSEEEVDINLTVEEALVQSEERLAALEEQHSTPQALTPKEQAERDNKLLLARGLGIPFEEVRVQ